MNLKIKLLFLGMVVTSMFLLHQKRAEAAVNTKFCSDEQTECRSDALSDYQYCNQIGWAHEPPTACTSCSSCDDLLYWERTQCSNFYAACMSGACYDNPNVSQCGTP